SANVMRPKSMATVVVRFSGNMLKSSTLVDASVMSASVRNGSISLTAPTNVVLPTPKPPATTILTESASWSACVPPDTSESTKPIPHPFQHAEVSGRFRGTGVGRVWVSDPHKTLGLEIGNKHTGHSERHRHDGRHLGDRTGRMAQAQNPLALGFRVGPGAPAGAGCRHERLDGDVLNRTCPSARREIRSHAPPVGCSHRLPPAP